MNHKIILFLLRAGWQIVFPAKAIFEFTTKKAKAKAQDIGPSMWGNLLISFIWAGPNI